MDFKAGQCHSFMSFVFIKLASRSRTCVAVMLNIVLSCFHGLLNGVEMDFGY